MCQSHTHNNIPENLMSNTTSDSYVYISGSSLCLSSQACKCFLRAPRNLDLYVVGKLLRCSFSEFTAGIAKPRTLGIKNC